MYKNCILKIISGLLSSNIKGNCVLDEAQCRKTTTQSKSFITNFNYFASSIEQFVYKY